MTLRRSVTGFIPIVIVGLAWNLCGNTQVRSNSSSPVSRRDSSVSCYDKDSGRLVGPNKLRTVVFESPDGTYRAYADTEALTHKKRDAQGDEYVDCENTSRLFAAGPQNRGFRQVVIVWPTPELAGNSIGLIDWSPKGHRLLIAEGLWGYGSDFGGIVIRIYDADSDKLSSESFVQEAFRRDAGKDCVGVFQPLGFSGDGGIIVRAGPYFDVGEEQPRADTCVAKEGVWLIAAANGAIRQLPDSYKPKQYCKEVARERAQ